MSNIVGEKNMNNIQLSEEEVKAIVGYHNYFRLGVVEAVREVQARCPDGYRVSFQLNKEPMPENAIVVGQIKVHHGDPGMPLYVYPIA